MAAVADGSGGPAIVAVCVVGALVACLVVAAFRVRSPKLPGVIAALALLLAVLVGERPGLGEFEPALGGFGVAALLLAVGTALLGVAHAVHVAGLNKAG
jgi:uncharacterized membrane protein (DUF4010 family)